MSFQYSVKQSLLSITHLAKIQNFLHILIYCDFTVVVSGSQNKNNQVCIPVGCLPSTCCPYLPACTARGGVCFRGGVRGVCSGGYLLNVGVWSRGCLLLEGVSAPGGISAPGGVSALGRRIPACTEADTRPMNRITDRQV